MSSLKKNYLYNTAYQILNICIPIITTPYLTRVLGADGIGVYSFSYSVAHFFAIFILLGLNNYGCREIAKSRDNPDKLSKTFWSIYFLQLFLGILVNGLYVGYCFLFSKNKIAALILGFYTVSAALDVNWFYFGLEKFKLTTIRNLLIKSIKTIAIFVFINDEKDIYPYCLIMAVGFLASQLVIWPDLVKRVRFSVPRIKDVFVHLKPNCLLAITTIAVSVFKYMDKVMLGIMSTDAQVGFYESAERIISVPTALITSLGTIMLPRMTALVSDKKEESNKLLHMSVLFAMLVSSAMCFGIMGVSREFVPLFYGDGYEICVTLYLILLPSCLFLAFANVVRTQYLLPHQMDKEYVVSAILGAITNLLVNAVLITRLGAVGVAVGTLVAEAVVCLYQSAKVGGRISLTKYIYQSIPFVLSGAGMFMILYFINIPNLSQAVVLLIKILCGVVVYFVLLLLLSLIFRINYINIIRESIDKTGLKK